MWTAYVNKVHSILSALAVTDRDGSVLSSADGFKRWVKLAQNPAPGFSIHLVGNGASASLASHVAADVTKNCRIGAGVFTDPALLTALSNDHGYENALAIALQRYANPGDLLVGISSSGESPNVINAAREAERRRVTVVTLTAKKAGNSLRQLGELNFYVDAPSFSLAESAHAVVLHHWIDCLEAAAALETVSAVATGGVSSAFASASPSPATGRPLP